MKEVALIQARKKRDLLMSLGGEDRLPLSSLKDGKKMQDDVRVLESRIQKKIKSARDRLSLKIYNNGVLVADNVTELDLTGARTITISGNRVTITI